MDKIIIKDKSKAAEDFVKRLNSYSNFGVFSIQDKGVEAKSVIFVILCKGRNLYNENLRFP